MESNNENKLKEVLQNSVELKRNAKGDYAWDIKVYFNEEDNIALKTIMDIDIHLKMNYLKQD